MTTATQHPANLISRQLDIASVAENVLSWLRPTLAHYTVGLRDRSELGNYSITNGRPSGPVEARLRVAHECFLRLALAESNDMARARFMSQSPSCGPGDKPGVYKTIAEAIREGNFNGALAAVSRIESGDEVHGS